ncbi:MAG: helix-turn-helix domain-containing protein [Coriobacteriales bacterium]|nr:helix-turn-helix domain-containing protein [Coriobacteriales bacterium]
MSYNVIVAAPLGNANFVVWFDGGVSRRYEASEVGITDEQDLAHLSVLPHGEGLSWGDDKQIDADALFELGEPVDYVSEEKARLLKDLSAIRRDASFSQTRLGEAAGIRQSVISRIEGCEISPQINTLLKLLAPLGKTLAIVDLED